MGRSLTDEEMREYEARRQESMRSTAELLGVTVEELKEAEEEVQRELIRKVEKSVTPRRKATVINAVKKAQEMAKTKTVENQSRDLESDDDPDELEALSAAELTNVLADKLAILKGNNRDSAVKTIMRMVDEADGSSHLSIRHEIILTLNSMIKSQEWREKAEVKG